MNRECRIKSSIHFAGPADDYIEDGELKLVTGIVVATPQCFSFIKSPLDGCVMPCIISLTQVHALEGDNMEVVELYTPLAGCTLELHTPAFN